MSRRMSCSLTVDAVRARTKTVTRRHVDTWQSLKPGDRLTLIEKGMGLPKGARQVVLAEVEVTAVMVEDIGSMSSMDCVREGVPHLSPSEFVVFWLRSHGYKPDQLDDPLAVKCRRIVWRYLDG